MRAFTLTRPRAAFAVVLSLFPSLALAQQDQNAADSATDSDAVLTSTYKLALARFAPDKKEMLRRAERAWITFSNKEEAVLNGLRDEKLLSPDADDRATLAEVNARSNHLGAFFVNGSVPTADPSAWKIQDRELTNAYAECMRKFGGADQNLLREAERAWIAYRDADSASTMSAYGNQAIQIAAATHLTALRVAQLRALSNRGNESSLASQPPAQNDSSHFEDAKAVAEFQDDAQGVLKALLAKKDDPFFAKADAIKAAPDLPKDITEQISKLDSRYLGLSRKFSSKLLEPTLNTSAAVKLLAGWSAFIYQLKSGSVDSAGSTIHHALDSKPNAVLPDYLLLWQTVESWQEVYAKDVSKFNEHIRQARALADLGKTSDAIKQYQEAYDIIENSSVPEQIKKLREQSLGL